MSPRPLRCISRLAFIIFLFKASLAQQPTPPPDPQQAQQPALPPAPEPQTKAAVHAEAEQEVKQEETQRLIVVVPNFNTVISGRAAPLSDGQKTNLAVHASVDPFNFAASFLLAGLSEYQGTHRGYGWGPQGYFKRVGANLADVVDSTMLAGAVYPILLHQDPRYFRQASGPLHLRIRHALLAPFICLGDNGHHQLNASNILGNYTAGAISNAYYPANERGVGTTLVNGSVVMVEGSLGNIGLEFAPDVSVWWHRRHNKVASTPPPNSTPD